MTKGYSLNVLSYLKKVPNHLLKPEFMPTKLVRISDMEAVDGSQVNEVDEVFETMEDNNYFTAIKYVKFECIIQQICQQFNIKYIWHNQFCINQNNKEKQCEIRKMHQIYENAYCTVALVPDYDEHSYFLMTAKEYFKRLWALEEALKSKRLLIVGRYIHSWEEDIFQISDIYQLVKSSSQLGVNKILYHAHQ
ncbi:hypothetical protein BDA99DRAFT_563032 [Phascolomyces articulosus]|uniref:Heterokaryon incompatibility domain-containing protein n=1 Tax=Phascolomyces articulosus TaxID=60185 RepID=A0AAD5PC76_9FUNG|nr:hypothetical protein BDA99DRAFT_563032 [Phascolomyces articulosus]